MKAPIKKKSFTKPTTADIKSALGMTIKTADDLTKSAAQKDQEFIPMPEAYQEALKLPGIPMGVTTLITGWSNTGKSTLKNCLIASCQNQGILPVIFETENNFDFTYAIDCGMKASPIYDSVEVEDVDPETGEITGSHMEEMIVDYAGDFLYFDNKILAEQYGNNDYASGKQTAKKRKVAVIEDIAYCINQLLDMQDEGKIQQPLCFIWDSVGSLGCYRSYTSKCGNAMFDAGAMSQAFSEIINNRIPTSKKVSEPYTNTFVAVNKIWNDGMSAVGGAVSIELKGGKTMYYGSRLRIHLGGVAKAATKRLTAVAQGQTYNYGIVTKIKVDKNQLPAPYNLTYENTICCVHNGIIAENKLDEYKKTYGKVLLKKLDEAISKNGSKAQLSESDLQFEEAETDE